MNKRLSALAAVAASVCLAVFHCGTQTTAGNGSHTGNPVAMGKILTANGKPAAGALVRIVPVDYVPSFALAKKTPVPICTTDANGNYSIYAIDSGAYNLEAVRDTLGVFQDSIKILPDSFDQNLGEAYLHRLGCISGVSYMPGQNDTNQVRVSIYMPGTGRITKPLIGGQFSFDFVPAGHYQIIFDPTLNTYNVKVLEVDIAAGECKNLDTVALVKYEPDTIEINQATVAGTWGPGKTYKVFATAVIPQGQNLTILSGTTIKLYEALQNYGKLIIQGSRDSLVTIEYVYPSGRSMYDIANDASSANPNDTSMSLKWVMIRNMHNGLYLGGSGVFISNCAFVNCGVGVFLNFVPKNKILNCVFWRNDAALSNFDCGTDTISVANSVFLENNTCNTCSGTYYLKTIFNSCLFYADSVLPLDTMITRSIYADPQFVSLDSLNPDFHLQPGSPCIKAGIDSTDIGLYSTYAP